MIYGASQGTAQRPLLLIYSLGSLKKCNKIILFAYNPIIIFRVDNVKVLVYIYINKILKNKALMILLTHVKKHIPFASSPRWIAVSKKYIKFYCPKWMISES